MTAEDYAELGIPDPLIADRIRGQEITGRWHDELPARCDECGDETGECGCDDDSG